MSDSEIEEVKKGLEADQKDPVFGAQMGMMPPALGGAPMPAPMGAPPGPPMESAENIPPTEGQPPTPPAAESLDYDSMKSLAIESGCDDELIKLLHEMGEKQHFNKITPKDGAK